MLISCLLQRISLTALFGFGGRVVIKSPEDVKAEYSSMVLNAGKSLGLFEYGESVNQTVQRVDKK